MPRPRLFAIMTLALAACSGSADSATDEGNAAATPGATAALATMNPITLSESDVEHFVAALEDLQRVGVRQEKRLGADPSDARQMAEGLRGSAEAMAVLERHGFDLVRFQTVGYSIGLAAAAAESGRSAGSMDSAVANLEKMKGQLPKEQYEAMAASLKSAGAIVEDLSKQPAGNVDLYRRYRERLERIGQK